MTRPDEAPLVTRAEWSQAFVLQGEQPTAAARSFVCRCLVKHRLFHLVDNVRVVAGEFATHSMVRAHPPSTLALSKSGPVVMLSVDTDGARGPVTDQPLDAWDATYGSRVVGLLSVEWGVRVQDDDVRGMWATFDARRGRRAVDAGGRARDLTRGPIPMVRGRSSPG